eukprot:1488547-Rhodomonas_salina.1
MQSLLTSRKEVWSHMEHMLLGLNITSWSWYPQNQRQETAFQHKLYCKCGFLCSRLHGTPIRCLSTAHGLGEP